ncbi:WD repeat-containing protein 47 [Blattella germanica]|nr:WD repeat-containing protein 47 [Blattella germanica]
MPSAHLTLREEDVVRLTLEFLHTRELHISQLSLERETGVINGAYSDDVLFLRQLILDGQWDDVLEFIQPLEALQAFDMRKFRYSILRHKYVELLCIKSEALVTAGPVNNVDSAVEDVVKVLNELERVAPSKEDYSNLCLLLTLPRLSDHLQYKDWNPSNARVQCFREIFPLVEKFLPGDRKTTEASNSPNTTARNDRLIHLIIKGILYESCVNYCQAKATGSKDTQQHEMTFSRLLDGSVGYSDSDLSLLSWLQSIPSETFSVPFEQRTLNVDIERLERPSLETSWTEHMLVTPIKPKLFPHSAMPFTRPRSAADIMSRSLLPALDGLPFGLAGQGNGGAVGGNNRNNSPMLMALSTGDINTGNAMSRSSFASFHLTGYKNNKLMNTSVDRLFENDGDVFLSSSYADFQQLPAILETNPKPQPPPRARGRSRSPDKKGGTVSSAASTPEHRGRESPATATSTARSSRRDSLTDKPSGTTVVLTGEYDGDLLKEYQRQKQRLQETLQVKERERDELIRQLQNSDNRLNDTK